MIPRNGESRRETGGHLGLPGGLAVVTSDIDALRLSHRGLVISARQLASAIESGVFGGRHVGDAAYGDTDDVRDVL